MSDSTDCSNLEDSFQKFFLKDESSENDSSRNSCSNILNSSVELDHNQEVLNKFCQKVQDRILYYQEENAKFEAIFQQCGLLDDKKCFTLNATTEKILDELCEIQECLGTADLNANALSMTYVDHLLEDEDVYLSNLKRSIRLYSEINEIMKKEISMISRELEASRKDVDELFTLTSDGVYALEKKATFYRNEMANFEKKYPWLKDQKLDLEYISKESNILCSLQQDKEALLKELSTYQGLKPDIQEALCQLSEKKREYERLKSEYLQGTPC